MCAQTPTRSATPVAPGLQANPAFYKFSLYSLSSFDYIHPFFLFIFFSLSFTCSLTSPCGAGDVLGSVTQRKVVAPTKTLIHTHYKVGSLPARSLCGAALRRFRLPFGGRLGLMTFNRMTESTSY